MKKLLLVLLLTTTMYAQDVYVAVDWSNALYGSDVNPPALNYKVGVSDRFFSDYITLGMEFESFAYLSYYKWTFFKFDAVIPVTKNFSILPGVGLSQIYHKTSYSYSAQSYAAYLEFDYQVLDRFSVFIQLVHERATDITQTWRDSAYGGIKYNI